MNTKCCNGTQGDARSTSGEPSASQPESRRASYLAPIDVYETGEEIVVVADVPGARQEDVDVNYEDGTLTISATVDRTTPSSGRTLLGEYGVGHFTRSLRFGQPLDVSGATASLSAGVLTLRLPKAPEARARKIQVGVN